MTRIAHFRNLASADSNDYVVYNDAKKRFELNNEKQWSNHRPVSAGNFARRLFVEALKREYPEIAQEIEPLLQQNGKPLKSWHVQRVLDKVDAMQAAKVKDAPYQPDLDKQLAAVEESVAEFVDAVAAPTGNLLFYTKITEDFRVLEGFQRQRVKPPLLEAPPELLTELEEADTALRPVDPSDPVEFPTAELIETPHVSPRQPRGMNPANFRRGQANPYANEENWSKSSKGKEHEYQRPSEDAPSPGKAMRSLTKAQAFRIEKDLYRRFKAISNDQKIAGKKDEFEIDAGDKAFAELFRKPPDCKILEDLTYKCAATSVSLEQHWQLPAKMEDWLSRVTNAESALDTYQVEGEMNLHLQQLKTDIEAIDKTLASNNLTAIHKEKLGAARRQLESMRNQLESPDKSLWTELSDYLKGIRPTLPAWTPQIDQKGRFHARKMLEKIGIADYNERKDPIVELANRMAKAYDLLRMELYAGGSWDSAYEEASTQDKHLLDEYRRRCFMAIEDKVKTETSGVLFDTNTKTYGILADPNKSGDSRRVSWQLNAYARRQWGGSDLWMALGYTDEDDPVTN